MPETMTLYAGTAIVKRLTFTLAAGEEVSRITLLLTRTDARSEHSTIGRARCIVLESDAPSLEMGNPGGEPASAVVSPRGRFVADLRGVVPRSICGGSYTPVFCMFRYVDGRPPTGFEIDADQRFTVEIADDATAVDAGPSITNFA